MSRLRQTLSLLYANTNTRALYTKVRPGNRNTMKRTFAVPLVRTLLGITAGITGCTCMYFLGKREAKAKASEGASRFVLYQYSNCPFCSKVRAYLHSCGQDFQIVEVNPITKVELKAVTEYRKVPTLIADGITLFESSVVNSILETHFTTGRPISECVKLYPKQEEFDQTVEYGKIRTLLPAVVKEWWYGKNPPAKFTFPNKYSIMDADPDLHGEAVRVKKWRKWIDDHFVHMISPNVYRTWDESLVAFDYFTNNGNFTDFQKTYIRYIGAMAMYKIGKKLKKRHNLAEDVRIDMYASLRKWTKGLQGRPFNGGDTPNLADIEMWGMCSAFHGMPTWEDACQNTKIAGWYRRMEAYLGEKSAIGLIPANPTLVGGREEQKQLVAG